MITLATTKQAIDEWRAAKISSNTPIPKKIWHMVEHLLSMHTKSEIRKVLGITSGQIRLRCAAQPTMKADNNFVEATPSLINADMTKLTIKGSSRTLKLCLPTTALSEVLPILGSLL